MESEIEVVDESGDRFIIDESIIIQMLHLLRTLSENAQCDVENYECVHKVDSEIIEDIILLLDEVDQNLVEG